MGLPLSRARSMRRGGGVEGGPVVVCGRLLGRGMQPGRRLGFGGRWRWERLPLGRGSWPLWLLGIFLRRAGPAPAAPGLFGTNPEIIELASLILGGTLAPAKTLAAHPGTPKRRQGAQQLRPTAPTTAAFKAPGAKGRIAPAEDLSRCQL